MATFSSESFLPAALFDRITELRVTEPDRVLAAASRRRRRSALTQDGRLHVLAADHPARRVTRVGDDPIAMANRHDYLARVVRVLTGGGADGVMATMDLLEELLLLGDIVESAGGPDLLGEKVLLASLNRGGLAGSSWELDDPMTGAEAETCKRYGLDGAKLLLRVADDDAGSLKTMTACARAVSAMNAVGLPTFLEPLPVVRADATFKVVKEAAALAKLAGVASALGDSSRLLWLKLPYCERYEIVARSTTLPILLLGGESVGDPRPLFKEVEAGLAAGKTVRGALVGRNVLYPGPGEDPLAVALAVDGIIHRGTSLGEALQTLEQSRGRGLDALSRWAS